MFSLFVDLNKLPQDNDVLRAEIIRNMVPSGIFYDSNSFHNSSIIIFNIDKGYPARLICCNSTKDPWFVKCMASSEVAGRTRFKNFLKYMRNPYDEFAKQIEIRKTINITK